jgi:hypothetical protein
MGKIFGNVKLKLVNLYHYFKISVKNIINKSYQEQLPFGHGGVN